MQIKDSAGVRIVEYAGVPEVDPHFILADELVYRHGSNPGDYEFQGINVGRLFPDGGAVVADRWNSDVVVLSPDGTTHEVLAKRGEGPGEVIYPYSMFVLGQDSVLVPDRRLSRLTLFVGDSVAHMASLPRSGYLGVAGIGSSGELLLMHRTPYRSWFDIEEEWLAGHMYRFEAETGALDTVASYDHWPRERSGLMNPIRPVGEVTVATGRFVQTRSDRPEIIWRLPDGTVRQIVRWRPEPTLLTEELLEPVEAYERMIGWLNYEVSDARLEEIVQENMSRYRAMIGQPLPLFGSPFADAHGNVWLPSYRPAHPEEGSPYTVMSPDGEWLGQVEAPPRFRILDVAGGLVLGVLRDEMDVENVVVYELVGGPSRVR
ncbi:hypothetical protein [Candidatus Palauibacter sp.]|uniref:hypothetical protein n=1 Tax=Candidatus Palauibacter sp. TaxID=3101350 RepID=UPI003B5C8D6C